jgi:Protein of unknown function (DUF664)
VISAKFCSSNSDICSGPSSRASAATWGEGRMASSAPEPVAGERAGLLQSLARQRHFLPYTTRGLTGEQAARQTTASELSLGGLIKHVALTGQQRMRFIIDAPAAMSWEDASAGDWMAGFKMLDRGSPQADWRTRLTR